MIPRKPFGASAVPIIGQQPSAYQGMTIVVVVLCACGHDEPLALVNAQPATCPHCQTVHRLEYVDWDVNRAQPKIGLGATPPPSLPTV